MDNKLANRRDFITLAGVMGGALISARALAQSNATPRQVEGPFYPIRNQTDKDYNMRQVQGHGAQATGQKIRLSGEVYDAETRQRLRGAVVELWQACASGKYNHPADSNNAPLDPHFQYWAQIAVDRNGRYAVQTIKPGAYPASSDWTRPPHIHVKVHCAGYPTLTTQLYFAGESLNDTDLILQNIPAAQQPLVIVNLDESGDEALGTWDIILAKTPHVALKHAAMVTPEIAD